MDASIPLPQRVQPIIDAAGVRSAGIVIWLLEDHACMAGALLPARGRLVVEMNRKRPDGLGGCGRRPTADMAKEPSSVG